MELQYLETRPGDVIIPPYEYAEDETSLLIYAEGDDISFALDEPECTHITIHNSQVDDLIEALKIMKENKNV